MKVVEKSAGRREVYLGNDKIIWMKAIEIRFLSGREKYINSKQERFDRISNNSKSRFLAECGSKIINEGPEVPKYT